MKIDGIRIQNYRSFDGKGIEVRDLGKVNVFVGKNNSGKSNILRFVSDLYKILHHNSNIPPFTVNDYFDYILENQIKWQIELKRKSGMEKLLGSSNQMDSIFNNQDSVWIDYSAPLGDKVKYGIDAINKKWFVGLLPTNPHELGQLRNEILNDGATQEIPRIHDGLYEAVIKNKNIIDKEIFLIDSFRQISKKNNKEDERNLGTHNLLFNGANLIQELNRILNPTAKDSKTARLKLDRIENFIKDVTGYSKVELKINSDENELSLLINNRQVRLENLGTGLHQLVILAISITLVENAIFCIEEPEIFLHPQIQKKLINYLLSTNNQYLVSTHSNAFINIQNIDVYHVINDGDKTFVEKRLESKDKNHILDDLGYHASDILQSNYVLWVEGPSDRIYINHWIRQKAPLLQEGIDYSIMFYGGSLRSHLTIDEHLISDFIQLNKINRNIGIVQDSDMENEQDEVNETKKRLIKEFEELNCFNWLTEGREIENYISSEILEKSIKALTKSDNTVIKTDKFSKVTNVTVNNKEKDIDKISLAREVNKTTPDYKVMDLDKKIDELIQLIKKANAKD